MKQDRNEITQKNLLRRGSLTALLVFAAILLLPLLMHTTLGSRYDAALELLEQGEYSAAREEFLLLDSFRDSYLLADYAEGHLLLESGNYRHAYHRFTDLDTLRDAPALAHLAADSMRYEDGAVLLAKELYLSAHGVFSSLGDFSDAREQAAAALHLHEVDITYHSAVELYHTGDLQEAYSVFLSIASEEYKETAAYMDSILAAIHEEVLRLVSSGTPVYALPLLDFLESTPYPAAETLRAQLQAQEYIVSDFGYDDITVTPITTFNGNTTAEEFAKVYLHMLLTGQRELLLIADPTFSYSHDASDVILDRASEAGTIVNEWLSVYKTVYGGFHSSIRWDPFSRPMYLVLTISHDTPYTILQLRTHSAEVDAFCEQVIRALNEALLLGGSMTNRQKAQVLYSFISYYMTYDDSLINHSAWLAANSGLGVCEAYAGLYQHLCNLVGIPSWGQVGTTSPGALDTTHIWTLQENEQHLLSYTDVTWGDTYDTNHSAPSIKGFIEYYVNLSVNSGSLETPFIGDPYYFWRSTLWDSHTPFRKAQDIVESYQALLS